MQKWKITFFCCNWLICTLLYAAVYEISEHSNMVGTTKIIVANGKESLFDIALKYDMGMFEILEANPGIKPNKLKPGTQIVIPSEYILPSGPREGIVLNLAELRMYFFHPNENLVSTYPVGIGRIGWKTPIGNTKIIRKRERPTWYPPKSIRAAYEKKGVELPEFIPPGPENPLGNYAINLDWDGYLIHGTNQQSSVGLRSSSGCIRMYAADIKSLFHQVEKDTMVRFIHEPIKLGKKNGNIYLESHKSLPEPYYGIQEKESEILKKELKNLTAATEENINWTFAADEKKHKFGYPVLIGIEK